MNRSTRILILLCTCIALVSLASCSRPGPKLRLVVPSQESDAAIVDQLVGLMASHSSIRIRLLAEDQTDEAALDALQSGRADIALVSNNMPFRPGITTVLPLYPTVLHIGHRESIDAVSDEDLIRGATIHAGESGSASHLMFERIASSLGIREDEYSYIEDADVDTDVFVLFAPVSAEHEDELRGYRLVNLGSPDDIGRGGAIDAMTLTYPQLRPYILPVDFYGSATPEPIVTVAVDMLLVARADLDTSVVYDLIRDLIGLRPALAAAWPGVFESTSDDIGDWSSTFVLHPGFVAYLNRNEPSVYERYSGIAEVVVTAMVAIFSASFAAVRIFNRRRKNRIDVFYTDILAIRSRIDSIDSDAERQTAAAQIKALQEKAFTMLVDEKLAADESFRIFISLSNDVLDEISSRSS